MKKNSMKCVILAGGFGTRLAEETSTKPKPMVKIGRYPILWHIMEIYSSYGFKDFIICTGYKKNIIENYFKKDLIKIEDSNTKYYFYKKKKWKIRCVFTGNGTQTAGRILRLKRLLNDDKKFFLTYGDGLSNIDIGKSLNFFKKHKKKSLITVVKPPARYGVIKMNKHIVNKFEEKIDNKDVWINGGFFIFDTSVLDLIKKPSESIEYELLPKLVKKRQLISFKHYGYWKAMDTLRDKMSLKSEIKKKIPGWKKKK